MGLHDDSKGGAKSLICLPEKQDNQNGYLLFFQTLHAFPKQSMDNEDKDTYKWKGGTGESLTGKKEITQNTDAHWDFTFLCSGSRSHFTLLVVGSVICTQYADKHRKWGVNAKEMGHARCKKAVLSPNSILN